MRGVSEKDDRPSPGGEVRLLASLRLPRASGHPQARPGQGTQRCRTRDRPVVQAYTASETGSCGRRGHSSSGGPRPAGVAHPQVTSTTGALIAFEGVSKRFRRGKRHSSLSEVIPALARRAVGGQRSRREEFWALRDVSFSIDAGHALGIIGPNGSGKSTALKLITGILRADGGRSEEHTSELQSRLHLVCRLLLEKKKQ